MRGTIEERFHSKYERIPFSGCWIWMGSLQSKDIHYGKLTVGTNKAHWTVAAHRLSYKLHKGDIPCGLHVCHTCDVPECVNPEHLFLGTCADNAADRDRKGRHWVPVGEEASANKLTENQVRAICCDKRTYKEIAVDYHIHPMYVGQIKRSERWKHLWAK